MINEEGREHAPAGLLLGEGLDAARVTRDLTRSLHERFRFALSVQSLFELASRVDELKDDSVERENRAFVVLDLHRLVLFHDHGAAGTPGICSLVRFLEDGHPVRAFDDFAALESSAPCSFAFDPAVLELVPHCLAELVQGEYRVLDLLTAEVLRGRLHRHPHAGPRSHIVGAAELRAPSPLQRATQRRGLRPGPPPDLTALVGHAAGVIRLEDLRSTKSSLALATCALSGSRLAPTEYCYGKGSSPSKARAIGRCEAAERFQVCYQQPGAELVRGSYDELAPHAVDPRSLFFGSCRGRPFDPSVPICWSWAWAPSEREWRLVPAQDVWFKFRGPVEPLFVHATTNGCAVGATFEEAAVHALLEAIERDGMLTAWYLRRPALEIDFASFDTDELNDLAGRFQLALPGYRAALFDLTSDIGIPTVGGLAIRERGSGARAYAAAAAHIEPRHACARVLEDLMAVRLDLPPETLTELRRRLDDVPRTPEAHFELYALDETFAAFDFLELGQRPPVAVAELGRESPVRPESHLDLDRVLCTLAERLDELGSALYLKDLTHSTFADYGLRAARAITPGLYPLWFGGDGHRLAITDRLRRLALAYTGKPLDAAGLNLAPHPLS